MSSRVPTPMAMVSPSRVPSGARRGDVRHHPYPVDGRSDHGPQLRVRRLGVDSGPWLPAIEDDGRRTAALWTAAVALVALVIGWVASVGCLTPGPQRPRRSIAVGSRVHITVVPGRLGRWEAAALRPEGPAA